MYVSKRRLRIERLRVRDNTKLFSHAAEMSRLAEAHGQEAGRIIIRSDLHTSYKSNMQERMRVLHSTASAYT
jgi:hypothetical protein